jgi:hypothetical protein
VDRLLTLLRSLGTAGAVANVRTVLEHRHREDDLVETLAAKLEPTPALDLVPAARPADRPAAPIGVPTAA